MKTILFAALVLAPASAGAQTLWGEVRAGMTDAEVAALRPAHGRPEQNRERTWIAYGETIGVCPVNVAIHHPEGKVTSVTISPPAVYGTTMSGLTRGSKCGDDAQRLLARRFGKPQGAAAGSTGEQRWTRKGVEILFRRAGLDPDSGWMITYRPAPPR